MNTYAKDTLDNFALQSQLTAGATIDFHLKVTTRQMCQMGHFATAESREAKRYDA